MRKNTCSISIYIVLKAFEKTFSALQYMYEFLDLLQF